MPKYFLSNKAVDDLSNIWNYTKIKWSEEQADKYYYLLLEVCEQVANDPKLAKEYDQVIRGLFGIRANRHVIFFRHLSKNEIEITRILHGKMDLKQKFKD